MPETKLDGHDGAVRVPVTALLKGKSETRNSLRAQGAVPILVSGTPAALRPLLRDLAEVGKVVDARAYSRFEESIAELDPQGWADGKILVLASPRRIRQIVAAHCRRHPDDLDVDILPIE